MIEALIEKEALRQQQVINLIASENRCSDSVKKALASDFTNKYAEGYPGKRYYAGNAVVDELENYVCQLAQRVFQTDYSVNVQPYSGSIANLAVYWALLEPGDTLMALELTSGGHLTHGHPVNISGKLFRRIPYTVNRETERLDYDELEKIAQKYQPKMIVSGASAYPREIDFKRISDIAQKVGAYHLSDISHISGLVAKGLHSSPFGNADVVTTTTHKLLRGPRGAMIFTKKSEVENPIQSFDKSPRCKTGAKSPTIPKSEIRNPNTISELIDKSVFPGIQGGPHMNTIAAIGVCLEEALTDVYYNYVVQVKENARVLSQELIKSGFRLISGGTDNHLILVDLRELGISGQEAQDRLEKEGVIVNKNAIPFDSAPPTNPSGIRLGTPFVTSRGLMPEDMVKIAKRITAVLR